MQLIKTLVKSDGDVLRIKYNNQTNIAVISVKLNDEPEEGFQFVCGGGVSDMLKVFKANENI